LAIDEDASAMTGKVPPATDPLSHLGTLSSAGQPGAADSAAPTGPNTNICGDFDIRIGRDGTWFYHGSPIGRKPLVRLFASVLRRDGDDYLLVTPVERGRIVVDDVPFTAVELDAVGSGPDQRLEFRTNLDDRVVAGPGHPIRVAHDADTAEPSPYIEVRDRLEARIVRSVYYQLVELGQERRIDGEDVFGVWSSGQFFCLGRLG
jgi:hypothetical protein